jgi:arylsulfatase A-like enzyme/Flp pilus assembly protein TadD
MRGKFVLCGVIAGMLAIGSMWLWPRQKSNLLLITLDTTRADRLGCYGYPRSRTPNLDDLATSGVLFERAYTVAPLTLPAHASLFTGLYPAENGVRSNGRGRLDDSIPTLAEVLKRQGYDTGAFVASFVLDGKFGLDRGFRKYDDEIAEEQSTADPHHREREGASVVDAALTWLQENRARPFFCWVHLYDPHAPYSAHADLFGDEFADRPYDGEIAYVDLQIGRLVKFLNDRGLASETLVAVVGDHGEGLGEHLERKHGMTLYNATMRVPLIFRQSGRLAGGRRNSGNVSIVDVSPTILDVLEIPETRKITGKSIEAAVAGGRSTPSPCYGSTDEPFLNNGWSPVRCLIDDSWKYIKTTRPELYDLANDPGEERDLAATNPDRRKQMESRLAEFESRLNRKGDAPVRLRPEERRALESLGYMGSSKSGPAAPATPNLPDIKDMLPFESAVEDAGELVDRGAVAEAVERLEKIVVDVPGHSKAHCYLADALRHQSKFDEAAEVLRVLLKSKPDAAEAHYGLGLVFLQQGRDDDAVTEFSKTLALDADYAEAHYDLAMIHVRRREAAEALSHFNAVLEIDHCHGAAYRERGTLLVTLGRVTEGIADYRLALKYTPNAPSLHHNLGIVLTDNDQADEALRHFRRAVELSPEIAEFRYTLGTSLAARHQYDEAVLHLAKALAIKPDFGAAQAKLQEARDALQRSGP